MSNLITIGNPYIVDNKINRTSRLSSIIKVNDKDNEIWYEVNSEFKEGLCTEKSDAFLVGILPFAMKKGFDIKVSGAISEKLYYQLTSFLIPSLAKFSKSFKAIKIHSKLSSEILSSKNGVGTGFSGGIDSFFTIAKNINKDTEKYNLTHFTFFNVGASGDDGGDEARKLFKARLNFVHEFATDANLPVITVDSNISEFLDMKFLETHTFRNAAATLAVQKIFTVYYYSSGHPVNEFNIKNIDKSTAYADLLLAQCLSTENTNFYITGLAENRIEKTEVVTKYMPSYKYLNVCLNEDYNCGVCNKCKRTLLGLYVLGELESYSAVFDLEKFKKLKNKIIVQTLANREDSYCREIIDKFKEKNLTIPTFLYIQSYFYRLFKAIYKPFSKIKAIKNMRNKAIEI